MSDDTVTIPNPRPVGVATFGDISKIIDDLAPVLDPIRKDLKLIALAAVLLILLDGDISLDHLPLGTDLLIKTAAKFVSDPDSFLANDLDFADLPTAKVN